MGTPGYIAPELYLGGHVDHRMDIFAAGVVFYQLLARKSPFRGGPEAIMHDVCYHDPEPASKADPAHRWPQYDAIVARAIAKAPADRYQSAADFRTAILDAYAQPVANTISEATIVTHRSRSVFADGPGSGGGAPPSPKTYSVAGSSAPPPTGWSSVVLSGVEVEIAKYVGPVAKVLVRRAAREHKDLESLIGALMPAIDDPKERSAFARAVIGKPMTTPLRVAPKPVESTAPPGTRPGDLLSAADLERATKVLIAYVGPIGKVIAKRAATEGVSRRDFFAKVSGSLDNDEVRERFMREAGFVEV
jgi:serine/threonine-protein kinase